MYNLTGVKTRWFPTIKIIPIWLQIPLQLEKAITIFSFI